MVLGSIVAIYTHLILTTLGILVGGPGGVTKAALVNNGAGIVKLRIELMADSSAVFIILRKNLTVPTPPATISW